MPNHTVNLTSGWLGNNTEISHALAEMPMNWLFSILFIGNLHVNVSKAKIRQYDIDDDLQ